jgi:hypothetical protein
MTKRRHPPRKCISRESFEIDKLDDLSKRRLFDYFRILQEWSTRASPTSKPSDTRSDQVKEQKLI